jgi:hypothetical protein
VTFQFVTANFATFTEDVFAGSIEFASQSGSNSVQINSDGIAFLGGTAATTRTNLGLGATWLTNDNVTNFRTAIGLGATNTVTFDAVFASGFFEVGGSSNTVNIDQDNGIQFGTTNLAAATRTNLGLPLPALTNTTTTNFRSAIGFSTNLNSFWGATNASSARGFLGAGSVGDSIFTATNSEPIYSAMSSDTRDLYVFQLFSQKVFLTTNGIDFQDDAAANFSRTNLRMPLPALTNTSNVTMMRALAGTTNTNQPFSGSISVVGTNNTNTLIFTNGILREVTTP